MAQYKVVIIGSINVWEFLDQFSIVFNEYKFGGMLNIMDNWKTSGLGVAENQNMKGIIRRQIPEKCHYQNKVHLWSH